MKLLRISYRNFKGIRKLDLEPNGEDLIALGDNATGKTTIVDGFTWLLFGKDSRNRADFQIKTLDENGEPVPMLEHSVEAVFDHGGKFTLKRTYKEKRVRQRGSAEKKFTGHETLFEVDGVPSNKTQFEARVASIADEKRFRLLTDPLYFNTVLHWKERREVLLDACGDVSFDDVIASSKELRELPAILDGRKPDDYRKIAESEKRAINEKIEDLPVRIDEIRESTPSLPTGSKAEFEESIEAQREIRRKASEAVQHARAGAGALNLRAQVAEVESRMHERRAELVEQAESAATEARRAAGVARSRADEKQHELRRLESESEHVGKLLARANSERARLRDEYNAKREEPAPAQAVADTCAACGQPLPPAKVEAALAKAREQFNTARSRELEKIREAGHEAKAEADRLESQLADLDTAITEARAESERLTAESERLRVEAEKLTNAVPKPEDDEQYSAIIAERDELRKKIEAAESDNATAVAEAEQHLRAVEIELDAMLGDLAKFEQVETIERRVAELAEQEQTLAREYETVEKHLFLLEQFTRAKVALLTDKINSRFERARFKLFEEQINEGIKDTCVCTADGVPFDSLNHGSRLNVGLDIINTLTEHFDFAPPVFIDNAESVTRILPTRGQAIKLVVSEAHAELDVRTAAASAIQ